VVRLSARASEQVFLSRDFIVHGERRVAGGDDGEEDTAETVTHLCEGQGTPLKHRGKEETEEKLAADLRG
jgi:hypothetical protein